MRRQGGDSFGVRVSFICMIESSRGRFMFGGGVLWHPSFGAKTEEDCFTIHFIEMETWMGVEGASHQRPASIHSLRIAPPTLTFEDLFPSWLLALSPYRPLTDAHQIRVQSHHHLH